MQVPTLDRELGMSVYATVSDGIGGVIRAKPEDFVVEEVLVDGSVASISDSLRKSVLSASLAEQRFLLCVLVKRRWDTFAAIKAIAKQLGIGQARIHIAGIKDAKAVTAQHIAIEGITADAVQKVCIKDIELHPIGYFRDALSSFYLLGNQFAITVRNIGLEKSPLNLRVAEIVSELELHGGMPNFFGHQRFGTTRAVTHVVGKAIVNGDFEKAALLFLANPSPFEHADSRMARETLQTTHNFHQALKNFPRQLRFERLMLHHLVENKLDFVGAFQRLPLKLQLLFVQAYQAYLFNRFLSERLRLGFSLNVAEVGDFVIGVDRLGLPTPTMARIVTAESRNGVNDSVKAGKLRVALPLVGFAQGPSTGEMGDLEVRILRDEGLELAKFRIQQLPRTSCKGELRSTVSPIRNFQIDAVCPDEESAKTQFVKLSFRLFRGSYATLLLRELMKPQDPLSAGF